MPSLIVHDAMMFAEVSATYKCQRMTAGLNTSVYWALSVTKNENRAKYIVRSLAWVEISGTCIAIELKPFA
jgi:hypothetical protein